MKILVVCQFYYPENFVISPICEELVKLGNDVTVLTGKPNYGYGHILTEYKDVSYEEINGVKVHRVDIKARQQSRMSIIKNYLSFWKNSKKWVKKCKEEYDIVYSMSLSPVTILSAGNLYKKLHNDKIIDNSILERITNRLLGKKNPVLVVPEVSLVFYWTYEEAAKLGIEGLSLKIKEKLKLALNVMKTD